MPMPPKPNPALDRIKNIKTKAVSRRPGGPVIEIEQFTNPIIEQAAREIAIEREGAIANNAPIIAPRLHGESEADYTLRMATIEAGRARFRETEEEQKFRVLEVETGNQLINETLKGVTIAPTRTAIYNQTAGQVDKIIEKLEEIDERPRIIIP